MSVADTPAQTTLSRRPKRADAARNYDKVIAAARDAFTEAGADASLEEIARRAGVGIGTLYRNFPNRQALLEAVYVGEVEALCARAAELDDLPPWEALSTWLRGFVSYMATKQALAPELLDQLTPDAALFSECRAMLYGTGEPLLARAQEAGAVRSDVDLPQVIALVAGIGKIAHVTPEQSEQILGVALDGLRYTGR